MSSEDEPVKTICPYCGVGCGLKLEPGEEPGSVNFKPWFDAPVNEGALCIKGSSAVQHVDHEDRLTEPLIKEDGEFREATWEEALDRVVEGLMEVREEYGPDATGFFASSQVMNEENYLMQKLARRYGTNNVDNCTRLCHASTVAALRDSLGAGAMTNSMADLRDSADAYWIQGANPAEQHVIGHSKYFKQAANDGTTVVQVDPHENKTSEVADIHLQVKPGTDIPILNVVLETILEEELYDEEFIAERTKGFESLEAELADFDAEEAAETAGVDLEKIREAARAFAEAGNGAIFTGMGMSQKTCGTDNVQNLINLALVTGNIGKPGTGVNPLRGQNNVQGTSDVGALPNVLPGYLEVEDPEDRAQVEDVWGFEVPPENGLTSLEVTDAAGEEVQGLYVMGENPVLSEPNSNEVEANLKELQFMVAQDIFMTETAKLADVVLPATSWVERGGTVTNTDRRVQRMRPAVDVPGNTRHDFDIVSEIGTRMFGEGFDYDGPEAVFEELREVASIYGGITYDRIGDEGIQWPCETTEEEGTQYLHKEEFPTEDGLGKIRGVSHQPPAEVEDEEYPLVLTTGRIEEHYNTGEMSRRSENLMRKTDHNFIHVHPADAEARGIEDGDVVELRTRRGEIDVTAVVTEETKQGVVWTTPHFADSQTNRVTNDAVDPVAKIPEFKVAAATISVDVAESGAD
ncbi:formate dehydrogenase subunit alpha [Halodesulfurarchaeum formicicum]|uniref:Formate dehydrogenase major subunit n=1 Tax=Halodesulfurarchaeum formicicum TaxID=1873524 RepID=A0A1D8S6F0_9EURY|nr:formate dehydrogenase subunit alpha [Halodesulfurarchaeum formicicum]AOW80909.1 formate dehydrogenase subunit alpha [Halodesulfurarchaeum formicicum]APE96242.1 formate dehydrogenase major subunit [Halodesulfurarchaeum formicicum]